MTKPRYSMIIQWSEEDQAYVVTLPEWGGCHTHGSTYDDAAKNGREVIELLMEAEPGRDAATLPVPHEFNYPGPAGYTYQFEPPSFGPLPARKADHDKPARKRKQHATT